MLWEPPKISLDDYVPIIGQSEVDLLHRLAEKLAGRRVLHVNSTRSGGGVAEILTRLVPLMTDVGLEARWEVIRGDEVFFNATKAFHNGLQGNPHKIPDDMFNVWLKVNQENRAEISFDAELIVIHDPQPLALVDGKKEGSNWAWRCHIDASAPSPQVWNYLKPWIEKYDSAIFSMNQFAQNLPIREALFHPTIDPLSEKNILLPNQEVRAVYDRLKVPMDRPILLQVSRFDRFKDPVGVIQSYRIVKRHHDCILVLAGGTAADDPEGQAVLDEVREAAGFDPDVYILSLPPDDRTINALQTGATLVIQKSVREGFGLTVAEALWKGKPVIGGNAGGITAQVEDGHTGYLVNSIEGAAYWIRYLLEHPEVCRRMGEIGREHVRRNFLMTQSLRNYLTLGIVMEHKARGLVDLS